MQPGQPGQPGQAGQPGQPWVPAWPPGAAADAAGGAPAIDPQQVNELLQWARENSPELHERLNRVRAEKPGAFMELLRDAMRERGELTRLKQLDPEAYELHQKVAAAERKVKEGVDAVRKAAEKDRPSLVDALHKSVEEDFDARQAMNDHQAARAEAELAKLKDRLSKRKEHRAEIIDTHVKELLGENEYLKW